MKKEQEKKSQHHSRKKKIDCLKQRRAVLRVSFDSGLVQ